MLYATLIMAPCAFAITHKEDRILLVKIAPPFKEAYKWNFPGGVIEHGEDLKGLLLIYASILQMFAKPHRDFFNR